MKRYCSLLGLLALVLPARSAPPVEGLIWRATSKTSTIYLVGSIHFGAKGMYPLPPIYQAAFDQASVVVEEVADGDKPMTFMPSIMKHAFYPPDDSLANHLQPATMKRLKAFAQAQGIPEESLDQMQPWLVLTMIPVASILKPGSSSRSGSSDRLSLAYPGIDMYFAQMARKAHKPLVGVETPEQQVQMLMALAPKDVDKSILEALGSASAMQGAGKASAADKMKMLVDGWIKGETSGAEEEIAEEHLPRLILEERNHHMADTCDSYLKSQKQCLFVVGFAHMLGKEGIVELLRAKGYEVVQIKSSPG